ncbi:hypothetical protein Zmor_026326 [Zophobas morio]|uniref:Uncharacterized protein n=1 Tax=Zophobas morio TaxID=2755281 RepID=A0AA38M4F1_9CUCU|nr:hypothetical protein Zmor_026326 [Zophobas morio]
MGSESESTDERDRKRPAKEGMFSRSKKTERTPKKKVTSSQDMLEKMMGILTELSGNVKEIKVMQGSKNLNKQMNELRKEQKEYRKKIEELKKINEQTVVDTEHLKRLIIKLRLEKMEKRSRKNNIVIQGLAINTVD